MSWRGSQLLTPKLRKWFQKSSFLDDYLPTSCRRISISGVPKWPSPRPNWVHPASLLQASVYRPPGTKGSEHTRLRVRGWAHPIRTTGEKAWHSVYFVRSAILRRLVVLERSSTESLSWELILSYVFSCFLLARRFSDIERCWAYGDDSINTRHFYFSG